MTTHEKNILVAELKMLEVTLLALNDELRAKVDKEKAKDKIMGTCSCCEGDFLVEDLFECDVCHKDACPDCIVGQKLDVDDFMNVCKNCLRKED